MKTQMYVKTGKETLFQKNEIRKMKGRLISEGRHNFLICTVLIAVLAVSGYAGTAGQEEVRKTAAPVVIRSSAEDEYESMSFEAAERRLREERAQEIAILNEVIAGTNEDEETRKNAQNQKIAIAKRMETEAQVRAALGSMGIDRAAAICAGERMVLIVSAQYAEDQEATMRMIDAASALSGCEAKDVKIILVKK